MQFVCERVLCVHWLAVSICNCWKVGQYEDSSLDGWFLCFVPIPLFISWLLYFLPLKANLRITRSVFHAMTKHCLNICIELPEKKQCGCNVHFIGSQTVHSFCHTLNLRSVCYLISSFDQLALSGIWPPSQSHPLASGQRVLSEVVTVGFRPLPVPVWKVSKSASGCRDSLCVFLVLCFVFSTAAQWSVALWSGMVWVRRPLLLAVSEWHRPGVCWIPVLPQQQCHQVTAVLGFDDGDWCQLTTELEWASQRFSCCLSSSALFFGLSSKQCVGRCWTNLGLPVLCAVCVVLLKLAWTAGLWETVIISTSLFLSLSHYVHWQEAGSQFGSCLELNGLL